MNPHPFRGMPRSLLFGSIASVGEWLGEGAVSAVELCGEVLRATRNINSSLGGYSQIIELSALAEAAASDARRGAGATLGPLDGIPVAVKDLIDTQPAVCKAGLDHLADYVPTRDATVVAALRNAGAVIIGVTETDPGAFSTDTPRAINPLDPDRTVGGSSGGSAAVVAAGLAFAAIGTDTGGSIRIPAACCSIFGFKPTWGRVPTLGVRPLAPSFDHVGPLARSVADLVAMQEILDPGLAFDGPREGEFSLGTCGSYYADAAPEVQASVLAVIQKLRANGVLMRDVDLLPPDDVLAFHMISVPKEAADYHTRSFPDAWQYYPEVARATVEAGRKATTADYALSEERRRGAIAIVDAALADVDAIILPTMPVDAPLRSLPEIQVGRRTMTRLETAIRYTALFNQTGHPVVSMPVTSLPDGRALSVQLVGKRAGDAALLALARRIEGIMATTVDYAGLVERQASRVGKVRAEIA